MNPIPPPPSTSPQPSEGLPLLVFGAHPDDIEFGCGAIIAKETRNGKAAHFVICSRGEAGTYGTPEVRQAEAGRGAAILGASVEFIALDGDAHLEERCEHAIVLARIIRKLKPRIVLAPTLAENQHPDHWRLGRIVRDAARLARYGGVAELKESAPHGIDALLFYAGGPDGEPRDVMPVLVDVSDAVKMWMEAMQAHESQVKTREYVELQIVRARLNGLRANVEYAVALYPNDPFIIDSLGQILRGARRF